MREWKLACLDFVSARPLHVNLAQLAPKLVGLALQQPAPRFGGLASPTYAAPSATATLKTKNLAGCVPNSRMPQKKVRLSVTHQAWRLIVPATGSGGAAAAPLQNQDWKVKESLPVTTGGPHALPKGCWCCPGGEQHPDGLKQTGSAFVRRCPKCFGKGFFPGQAQHRSVQNLNGDQVLAGLLVIQPPQSSSPHPVRHSETVQAERYCGCHLCHYL